MATAGAVPSRVAADPLATSPRATARLAGLLYLASAVPAGFTVWVVSHLVVRGDPAATAARIAGSQALFRAGLVADLVGIVLYLGSIMFLYELLRPASRRLAWLMVTFNVLGAGIQALDALRDLAALHLLSGGPSVAALGTAEAQALAFLFLRMHGLTYDLALFFYGVGSVLIGTLILHARFLPRAFAALMWIDGLGYLTFTLATFLAPAVARRLYPALPFATGVLGELTLVLWLIVKAVDAARWQQQADLGRVAA